MHATLQTVTSSCLYFSLLANSSSAAAAAVLCCRMLARGRRVNREFAFISYSTPLEAARAVHWLDGCRLVDLEKDKNGITVEYENGEGEGGAGAPCK